MSKLLSIAELIFTQDQKHEIEFGKKAGLDVSVYAKNAVLGREQICEVDCKRNDISGIRWMEAILS
ncbi:MAG: hypothetical protein BHW46_11730 [Roseburia intestinalis]|nr:MAG: hypothetical protein BHW46_11730 [Roseburia intestinalis]